MSASNGLPDAIVADDIPPLVKPGIYELAFVDYKTAIMFKGKAPKLIMNFRIITFGDYFETELSRYYNVQRIIGKPRRHGCFKCGKTGSFLREYMTLFTGRVNRLDRIPMSLFQDEIIEGVVGTVTRSQGRNIPKELQYSVITELRRLK